MDLNSSENSIELTKWNPEQILNVNQTEEAYAIIILNRKILFHPTSFQPLWNNASIRVVVDGGANHWFNYMDENALVEYLKAPDYSTGDMDSITKESIKRLEALKCKRICTPDQNHTDCTKSIIAIQPLLAPNNIKNILLITDFGGRIDQTISQISTLFKAKDIAKKVNVYMHGNSTLAWLMCSGQHEIKIPEEFVTQQYWCSYIPINGKTFVTTTGFKWDIENTPCAFGGLVSTSNTYKKSTLRIKCDNYLFWAMCTEREAK